MCLVCGKYFPSITAKTAHRQALHPGRKGRGRQQVDRVDAEDDGDEEDEEQEVEREVPAAEPENARVLLNIFELIAENPFKELGP